MSEATTRVRLCATDDIEPGGMLKVMLPDLPDLAVYRIHDEYYCTQDLCTHGNASLSDEGDLEGYVVECTWHGGKFDIRSGQVCALPCVEPLKTYAVVVENGEVFVQPK